MGLFGKKKNTDNSDSVLTESEIKKKLYGEFDSGPSRVLPGGREYFNEHTASPVLPAESRGEKAQPQDLFSTAKDDWGGSDLPPRQNFSEPKPSDSTPRYVPLHDFEKRSAAPVPPAAGVDANARFRYNRPSENKMDAIVALGADGVGKIKAVLEAFSDPKQVTFRRFFYWGVAVLVIFLLFWGVNTLNSQREEAMRVRYKMPGKVAAVQAPVAAVSVPVVEREVTITPAPVRVKKSGTVGKTNASEVSASGSYVIQVVTYPNKQDASQIVESLKRAGLRAFVQENARPSGRVFYLVLIGGFRTAADAQAQLVKFKSLEAARPFQDSFVRTNRS